VFFGCGSAVGANVFFSMTMGIPPADAVIFTTLLISLAFGLALTALVYVFGGVSGCHVNPAVSLAMLIDGRLSVVDFLGYIASQFLGGIAGAGLLTYIFSFLKAMTDTAMLGQNGFGQGFNTIGIAMPVAIVIEVILTMVFVLTVLSVTKKKENAAVSGLVIGLALALVHIFGVPFTGTSVNPARSFGPAMLAGGNALQQVWVFLAAPLAGAVLAALIYRFVVKSKDEEEFDAEEFMNEIMSSIEEDGWEDDDMPADEDGDGADGDADEEESDAEETEQE
jgi:aquaporin Z